MTSPFSLDFVQFERHLASLSPKKRALAILDRPDAKQIVQVLPPQDLMLIIKECGLSDSLELIELLSAEQVRCMLDLDGWRGDRLNPTTMGEWLECLSLANRERAMAQFVSLDIELISLLFKVYATVYDYNEEEGLPSDIPLYTITPDRLYIVVFDDKSEEKSLVQFLKQVLEQLYEKDIQFVHRLVEGVRWETPSMLEEEELRLRNGRLEDLGFTLKEDAQKLFYYLDPDSVHIDANSSSDEPAVFVSSLVLPTDYENYPAFKKALQELDLQGRERILGQLTMTINSVHQVISGEFGDVAALKVSTRRCMATCEMALSYLAIAKSVKESAALQALSIQTLFRVGNSLSLRLQRQAKALLKNESTCLQGAALARLDSPLRESLAGLLKKTPLFFEGLVDAKSLVYRPFDKLTEVIAATHALSEAALRAAFIGGDQGLRFSDAYLRSIGYEDEATQPQMWVLLATWIANSLLSHDDLRNPFDEQRLRALLGLLKDSGSFDDEEAALNRLPVGSDEPGERLRKYAAATLATLKDELVGLKGKDVDMKFVNFLLQRRSSESKA